MSEILIKRNKFASLDSDSESDSDIGICKKKESNIDIVMEKEININKEHVENKPVVKPPISFKNIVENSNSNLKPTVCSKTIISNGKNTTKNSNFNTNSKTQNYVSNSKTPNQIDKVEEDMFKQYYGKKAYSSNKIYNNNHNYNQNHNQNNTTEKNIPDESGFVKVASRKREERVCSECVIKELEENVLEMNMENYFRVLAHHNDDKSWDYNSYHNITTLKKWNDLGSFFNTLNNISGECTYTDFDIFVMKNEISPMWEDNENRNGSICSVKIDSLADGYNIFKTMTIGMANNTLLKFNPHNWNAVNGISFSSKKLDNVNETYCIIIKIWFKINILSFGSVDKILNENVNNLISKYSIKTKPIKPEY